MLGIVIPLNPTPYPPHLAPTACGVTLKGLFYSRISGNLLWTMTAYLDLKSTKYNGPKHRKIQQCYILGDAGSPLPSKEGFIQGPVRVYEFYIVGTEGLCERPMVSTLDRP